MAGEGDVDDALERQVAELDALLAIFEGDEEVALEVTGLEEARARLEGGEGGGGGGEPASCLTLTLTFPREAADRLQLSAVRVRLPRGYPSEGEGAGADVVPDVALGSRFLVDACQREAELLLESERGQECLFQVVSMLKEAVQEGMEAAACDDGDDDEGLASLEADFQRHVGLREGSGGGRVTLGRRLCFSHHIIAPGKRQAVISWALQLKLGGCSKIGWPGLIAVEGDERDCQLYVSLLQRLRWKRFTVRGEEQVEGAAGESIDAMRRLPRGFAEFQQDEMHLFAQLLRESGCTDLLMTFMKGHTTSAGAGGEATAGDGVKKGAGAGKIGKKKRAK